jgi:hypothetical protein
MLLCLWVVLVLAYGGMTESVLLMVQPAKPKSKENSMSSPSGFSSPDFDFPCFPASSQIKECGRVIKEGPSDVGYVDPVVP